MDGTHTVKIVRSDGTWIVLRGEPCSDHLPAYGTEFYDGEEERLIEWLNREQPKKLNE